MAPSLFRLVIGCILLLTGIFTCFILFHEIHQKEVQSSGVSVTFIEDPKGGMYVCV